MIVFYASEPTDVVDSPTVGRIGPVPYARTGGHVNRGVAIVKAAECQPGSILPPGHVRDIAPTILSWLGAPGVERLAGVSFKPGQLEDARARARA